MGQGQGFSAERGRFDAVVERNERLCREHYVLRLRVRQWHDGRRFPPTRPGQFVQLGCRPPNGAIDRAALLGGQWDWQPGGRARQPELCDRLTLLRRPFSLADRGEDERGVWLEVVHRVVGVGTQWLAQLQPGAAVDLIGPLGNAFTLPADKSVGLLVGGGVGLPPMFYLAQALAQGRWEAVGFVGATTADLLAVNFERDIQPRADGEPTRCVSQFARHGFASVVCTDDGTRGLKGRITAGVERWFSRVDTGTAQRTVVFTCGPEPMMHAVWKLARKHGVDCQVCLEQAMACGMGTCQSCVVRIEDRQRPQATTPAGQPWRYRLACTDGPVFDARQVVW